MIILIINIYLIVYLLSNYMMGIFRYLYVGPKICLAQTTRSPIKADPNPKNKTSPQTLNTHLQTAQLAHKHNIFSAIETLAAFFVLFQRTEAVPPPHVTRLLRVVRHSTSTSEAYSPTNLQTSNKRL
ncbi:hypothetical protein V6Z11_A13G197800 [Gossypium hirsutum]